jgi:hypothetical protein
MSALPPIKWGEKEREIGAVSFTQHLKELTSTHTSSSSTTDKINSVVATVVPHLVDALKEELLTTSTTIPVTTTSPTTTPSSIAGKLNKVVTAVVPQLVEIIKDELAPTSITPDPGTITSDTPHTSPPTCGSPPEPQVGKLSIF